MVSPVFWTFKLMSKLSPDETVLEDGEAVSVNEGDKTTLKELVVAVVGLPAMLINTLIVWLVNFSLATRVVHDALEPLKDFVLSSELENPEGKDIVAVPLPESPETVRVNVSPFITVPESAPD